MPEIAFLTGVGDRVAFTLRLIRKKHREGSRLAVLAPAALLQRLDHALWSEDQAEFLPHLRPRASTLSSASLRFTRVWLLEGERHDLKCDTAINLGLDVVPWLASHPRVAEVVGLDGDDQRSARLRWKAYESMGLKPAHRAIGKPSGTAAS